MLGSLMSRVLSLQATLVLSSTTDHAWDKQSFNVTLNVTPHVQQCCGTTVAGALQADLRRWSRTSPLENLPHGCWVCRSRSDTSRLTWQSGFSLAACDGP
jgi:hypothetical protein